MLPSRNQRGAALLLVLWVVALLTVLAVSLLVIIQRSSQTASQTRQRVQIQALADSALNQTIWMLTARDPGKHPSLDGRLHSLELAGGQARVAVTDEAGRIDLNMASIELLQTLVLVASADAVQSESLLSEIDARRRKSIVPFLDVADLKSVSGMTTDLYSRLESATTVYTRASQPDPRFAAPLAAKAVKQVRRVIPADPSGGTPLTEDSQSLAGRVLRIQVEVTEAGQPALNETAVLRLTGDSRLPYWVMAERKSD